MTATRAGVDAARVRAEGDAFVASFSESIAEIRERAERARGVMQHSTGSATREHVTATVDASGALVDLRIGAVALELGADDLARVVLSASLAARRELLGRAQSQISEILGPESASMDVLRTQLAELDEQPERGSSAARPSRATRYAQSEDDGDDYPVRGR